MFSSLQLINQFPNNKYGFIFLVIRSVEQKICAYFTTKEYNFIICFNCYFKNCILEFDIVVMHKFFALGSISINVKRPLLEACYLWFSVDITFFPFIAYFQSII